MVSASDTRSPQSGAPGGFRLRLLKVGARIIETTSRIRIAFASACPDADLFRQIALRLRAAPT